MPLPSRRIRPTRLILAGLLAGLIAPGLAAGGHAEDRQISLTVHVGYRDITRAGQWMPVTVDATNRGSDFQGVLELQSQDANPFLAKGAFPGPNAAGGPATYRIALNLPAGASKHLRSYVLTDNPSPQIVARLVENGHVAASQPAIAPTSAGLLVGVLSDQPSALDDFGALHLPGNQAPQVVHLRRDDIADSGILLRAFDVLAIDDFPTDSLTAAQRTALGDYVAVGGNLLLGLGAAWHKTLGGLPPDLVPMQITGTTQLKGSKALPEAAEVATGSPINGQVWLSDAGYPLLIERPLGSGTVTLATFDWAQDPVFGWSGTRGLLRKFAVRNFFAGQGQTMPFGIGGAGGAMPAFYGNTSGSITQRSNYVMGALQNLPALDLPSLRVTGLLVLLYVLLVGPLNYIALRAIGRRELAWITVPVVAVVFAAGAYGLAVTTKGRSVQSNQVSIVHVASGWKDAYQETYTGIFTPTRGDYQVAIGGGHSLIAPLGYAGTPSQGSLRVLPDQNAVDLLGVTAYTLRGFATESTVAAPQLTVNVKLSGGKLVGRIENHASVTYPDAVLIAGDSYQIIGKLAPGAGADIELEAKVSAQFGGGTPLAYRIYSSGQYFGPRPYVGRQSDAQREAQERGQVLQLLVGNYGFKGMGLPVLAPQLIVWTRDSVQPIKVNGSTPRPHALNAIAIPLAIDALGPGTLPAGIVTGRLVDVDGEAFSQGPPGTLSIQSGSATFEFSPRLTAGSRLTDISISSSNPYGRFGPGGVPAGAPTTEAWDWSKSAWVPVSLKENTTTAVPDSLFDSITGTLRLRISSAGGSSGITSFTMPTMSLTGTVQ
jgi:hypothetical protein